MNLRAAETSPSFHQMQKKRMNLVDANRRSLLRKLRVSKVPGAVRVERILDGLHKGTHTGSSSPAIVLRPGANKHSAARHR